MEQQPISLQRIPKCFNTMLQHLLTMKFLACQGFVLNCPFVSILPNHFFFSLKYRLTDCCRRSYFFTVLDIFRALVLNKHWSKCSGRIDSLAAHCHFNTYCLLISHKGCGMNGSDNNVSQTYVFLILYRPCRNLGVPLSQ